MLDFQSRCEKLFDLIFCKCKIISCEEAGCEGCCDSSAHITCTCKREKKIPLVELAYVMDQRNREGGKGQFQMTDLDKKVTSKMQESQDRKAKDKKSSKPISSNNNHKDDQNNTDDMPPPSEVADIGDIQPVREGEQVQESFDDNDPEDSDFTPDFLLDKKEKNPSNRNMMSLKNVVRECMRWGVSPKAGASIANAALIDAGVVNKDNQTKIITRTN